METQTQKTERPDRKDWLREYETIYVMPADTTDEAADKINERFRELVGTTGGRVIKFTTWGRRKTAFEVRRQPRALFVHMAYLGSGKTVTSGTSRKSKNSSRPSSIRWSIRPRVRPNRTSKCRVTSTSARCAPSAPKAPKPKSATIRFPISTTFAASSRKPFSENFKWLDLEWQTAAWAALRRVRWMAAEVAVLAAVVAA